MDIEICFSGKKAGRLNKVESKNYSEKKHGANNQSYHEFVSELAKGYLFAEIMEKEKTLKEYLDEYEKVKNTNSLKEGYLDSYIFILQHELKMKKRALT